MDASNTGLSFEKVRNHQHARVARIDGARACQGHETTLFCVDEDGMFRDRRWVDMPKSNLRVVASANPGGPLHAHFNRCVAIRERAVSSRHRP